MHGVIPFESMPGIPPLFLAFARGDAATFFPDPPTFSAVEERARALVERRGGAVVATGQQAGLLGGPLLSLTKAAAAAHLSAKLRQRQISTRGLFWIASEDHDLNEVAQATLLRDGAPRVVRLPVPPRNFQPSGTVALPPEVAEIFSDLGEDASVSREVLARFSRAWKPGRTYAEAFRATLEPLLPEEALEWVDPLDPRWKKDQDDFFRAAFLRAEAITGALDAVDERLRAAGHAPQVTRAEGDFPAFVIEDGVRRKISWDGKEFSVHGHERRLSAEALADFVSSGTTRPSAAALLRPVLQARLFPVAAEILGPSELAYHAQTAPLFDVLDVPRPVFLPRPHLLPRGARERRALHALGVEDRDLFRARDVARGEVPPVSPKITALERELSERLRALAPEIREVDATLEPVLAGAAEKIAHQLARLREKVERAADRRDVERVRRLDTIESFLTPGHVPADRVYGPLTYLLRFGDGFVPELLKNAECRSDGARFLDFE